MTTETTPNDALEPFRTYWKTTNVQRTWQRHGWTPPSKDPETVSRWAYFRSLDTEQTATEEATA